MNIRGTDAFPEACLELDKEKDLGRYGIFLLMKCIKGQTSAQSDWKLKRQYTLI